MKVTKKGNIRLEKGEIRVGNFFFRDEGENEHIRVVDLNSCFTLRVYKRMPLGIWLDNMLGMARTDGKAVDTLKTWVAVMWSLLSVAPDDGFVEDAVRMSQAALERHPDWYGVKAEATDEDDAAAVSEVEGMNEFESELKDAMEKEQRHED